MYPRHRGLKILAVIALLLTSGYLVIKMVGERYLQQIIQSELQRQRLPVAITMEKVQIDFPLQVVLKRVSCAIVQSPPQPALSGVEGPVFSAARIVVNPQLVGFMMGRVVLDGIRVEQPSLVLTRRSEQAWNVTLLLSQASSAPAAGGKPGAAAPPRPLLLEALRIDDGTVTFTDETVVPAFRGELRRLDLEVKKLPFPLRAITTSFEATGEWVGPIEHQRAPLAVHGWLDLLRKKGEVNYSLHDLDVTTLEPYFGKKLITKLYAGLLNVDGEATLNGHDEVLVKLDLDLRDLQISGGDLTLETLQAQAPALGALVTALQQNQHHVTQHLELKYLLNTKRWRMVKMEGNLVPLLFAKSLLGGVDRIILKIQEGVEATGQDEAIKEKIQDAIGGTLQQLLDKALPAQ